MTAPSVGPRTIVTGAGRGIGQAISIALAATGAQVVLAGRSVAPREETAALVEAAGGTALVVPTDVTDEAQVQALVDAGTAWFGQLDLLVNNAGGSHSLGPLWSMTASEWWADIELNFKSVVLCTHAVLPGLMEAGAGRIINIGSLAGVNPNLSIPAYCCAKAALTMFGETLARTVAEHGISVFTLSPGTVYTPIIEETKASERGKKYMQFLFDAPMSNYIPAEVAADHVVTIASGAVDVLAGRFLHARDDLHQLAARAPEIVAEDRLVLRLAALD
jgi:NAD(P)-dependent dehydrogenase (short-subunit alcohol dehydrogenase family)